MTAKKPSSPPVKPFKHQSVSLKHAETTPIVFDTSDPGTGKTYVRIKAFEKRHKQRKARKCLVLAPKSLLRSVWANDIKKFAPNLRVSVSTAGKHEMAFAEDADVYVTNIDAVKWLDKQPKKFFAEFDELIIDESSAYKHGTSQRSKAAARIAKHFKFRSLLTGTPNSNSITDVWHQAYILDGGKRLGYSFIAFRNTVCEPTQVGRNENAISWKDKEGAEEAVFNLLSDITIRHKFEDCVDIPANHQYTLEYAMPANHRKAFDQLRQAQLLEIYGSTKDLLKAKLQGKPLKSSGLITAMHAGVLANKLLQLSSGAVYESPDKYHVIDTGRYEMVLDLVEQRKHSLVMFLWKHQRDLLIAEAERRGVTFALIDGTVKESERTAIVNAYQRGAYQTIFAHPKSAGHGLTLTKGTATIWASPTYDAEIFVQASKRQHRIGQTQKTETITLLADNDVEQHVHDLMTGKKARMTNLLDLFSNV